MLISFLDKHVKRHNTQTHTCTHMHTQHTCTHTTHTCTQICTHTCTNVHTHAHTHRMHTSNRTRNTHTQYMLIKLAQTLEQLITEMECNLKFAMTGCVHYFTPLCTSQTRQPSPHYLSHLSSIKSHPSHITSHTHSKHTHKHKSTPTRQPKIYQITPITHHKPHPFQTHPTQT